MKGYRRALGTLAVVAMVAASLTMAGSAAAEESTLFVDDDGTCDGNVPCYVTIQEAIDAATAGDTVFVHNGTYYEHLVIDKDLTLLAEDLDGTVLVPGDEGDPMTITADNVTIGVAEPLVAATAVATTESAAPAIYVDDDLACDGNLPCYATVQEGVNAAATGDTVFVYGGTYAEHVTISKSLTLEGEDRNAVVIDGGGSGNVVTVTANYVTIRALTVTSGYWGIYMPVSGVHHVTLDDLVVKNNTNHGIWAPHSNSWGSYHSITNSLLAYNGASGFRGHQFSRSVVQGNTFAGNSYGFEPGWGLYTLVTDNLAYDNSGWGIWFDSMYYSTAENNRVWENGGGIGVGYVARSNVIRNNAVCANNNGFNANYPPVRYNLIYLNDVEANATQAKDLGSNYWDNGSLGNYWADYTGVDTDLDGIGDTPYTFNGGQDNYPLMEPTIFAAPTVTAWSAPLDPIKVDTPIAVSAAFADPDSYLTHMGTWDWDDETVSAAVIDEEAMTATGEHTYTNPGVYAAGLTLDDLCGPEGTAAYEYIVVYDPDAGFVTGGGWIYSEPGAYVPDPLLEGKATFGFVSKYKKGATVPAGNTEFQFKAADLNFHSNSYDWLVVTGSDYAKFKGLGTINGEGEYKFQIWAGDGESDTFRIKIWTEDEATGLETIVYDNGFDQEIGGGSIIVHTKK